nr:hypothetical protein [Tanacetum cinerariifolium]
MGHFARECKAPRSQDRGRRENFKQGSKVEESAPKALMAIDGVGCDWSYMANEEEDHALVANQEAPTEFALMAKSSSDTEELEELKKKKEGLDIKLTGFQSASKDLDTLLGSQRHSPSIESNSSDLQNINSSIFEKGDTLESIMSKPMIKFVKVTDSPSKVKISKVETIRKPFVKYAKMYRNTTKSPKVRGNQRNWNNLKTQQLGKDFVMKNKACFKCGQFDHLAYDCVVWEEQGKTWPKNNNTHKSMSPRIFFYKTSRQLMKTNRPNMNAAQPKRTSFTKPAHSYVRRPFQRTSAVRTQFRVPRVSTINTKFPIVNKKFPTGNSKLSTADLGNKGKAVNASACWIWKPKQNSTGKGYWDSGYSRHMTGNISYLSDYEPYDGGVLFTDSKCIVLGRDFKLKDDTNVLHRTPRQHNMYSIDLNNIVPHKDLTCLVVNTTADESVLWHRRLGHLNFKTMNKLVRHNLVRGLPSKCFENDHTCVACLKGKQHKASCKTKLVHSVTKPLHTLHMDLFGPTSVSSLNRYIALPNWFHEAHLESSSSNAQDACNTNAPKSSGNSNPTATSTNPPADHMETLTVESPIPTVSSDVLTAFLNDSPEPSSDTRLISKRVTSQDDTPSLDNILTLSNRKNLRRFLMLSKTQARVLVNNSQNKTPYELFNGRTHAIGFLKPFGCHVMILNTFDNLGKFDAKGDEGYIALPNWFHEAHLESSTSNAQDACNTNAPKSSGNSNPTATSTNPPADHMETLIVESLIPTVSSDVPTTFLNDSPEPSSLMISLELQKIQEEPKKISDALKDPS